MPTGSTTCRAGRKADGRRSSPSGLSSSPGAAPATPVRPYCQTIAFVRGSTRITRWFQSSVAAINPFGRRTASDGLSSRSGPVELPKDHVTRPERVTSTILPGSVKAATRTRPFGSSCASDGYETGERIDHSSRPSGPRRSIQPPISVTRRPPSRSGVSPFGLAKPRGGSCTHEPPRMRLTCFARVSSTMRQFLMSATVVSPSGNRYASSGVFR